ncbi:putative autotransporter adhesin-like protein [Balneicella halophila]|uniref:Putative autotransporter adhesin-like protein n=1 Tax=Balneicella halophila TaxID=1537566 RepID=A0A7L4USS5_BALHA|nr:head GIN domain-containing protein [Balneicella halophila]PVX52297.1 putative autotransporter adhesin-like protein [Balneicella halophila]
MKYFFTLLGVATFVVILFAFKEEPIIKKSFEERMILNSTDIKDSDVEKVLNVFAKGEKGNKEVVDEVREVDAFKDISSQNAIKVKLVKGQKQKVVVRTDSNLQDNIITEVKDGKLKIYVKDKIRKYTEMTVFVTFTELESLSSSSASEITCEDKIVASSFYIQSSSASSIDLKSLEANTVEIDVSSAANVRVSGKCEELKVDASSASSAKLYDLIATNVDADASSAAHIEVYAVSKLDADASSGADIEYKGDPEFVNRDESSGGDVSVH